MAKTAVRVGGQRRRPCRLILSRGRTPPACYGVERSKLETMEEPWLLQPSWKRRDGQSKLRVCPQTTWVARSRGGVGDTSKGRGRRHAYNVGSGRAGRCALSAPRGHGP